MFRRVILLFLVTFSVPLLANPSRLSEQVAYCAAIKADSARLACYDQLAKSQHSLRMKNQLTPQADESSSPAKAVKTPPDKDKYFVIINSVERDQLGHWRIKLSNGQIWQQQDDVVFTFNHKGRYYIEKGFWGARFMGNENVRRRMRIKKVE